MSRRPKEVPFVEFVARHAGVLVEMTRCPNGATPTEATPGWVMARFVGGGLATYRVEEDRVGKELRFRLTDAGARTAETLAKSVERGRG